MVQALGLSEAAYGLGASLFFIGYFLFEAPSNLILARVGARVWFARIMFTWGLVTLALGFTQNATMFYILRFLLGVTEAGFLPGRALRPDPVVPAGASRADDRPVHDRQRHRQCCRGGRGRPAARPRRPMGFAGWQWVFLVTGAPAVLLAPYVLWRLPNGPTTARGCRTSKRPGWPRC
jgi:MFS family permease